MIVVVEGPSAAGKTTWVRKHHGPVAVWETEPTDARSFADGDDRAAAAFWAGVHNRRWATACATEARHGVAVCDTDPCKLHYTWTLWKVGETTRTAWEAAAEATRASFEDGRCGLADLFLVSVLDRTELQARKDRDTSRRRHNFRIHARLAEPLRAWYQAVERIEPGRVQWSFPSEPVDLGGTAPRPTRTGVALFDALIQELPP